jgi:hypothetical protein
MLVSKFLIYFNFIQTSNLYITVLYIIGNNVYVDLKL